MEANELIEKARKDIQKLIMEEDSRHTLALEFEDKFHTLRINELRMVRDKLDEGYSKVLIRQLNTNNSVLISKEELTMNQPSHIDMLTEEVRQNINDSHRVPPSTD